MIKNVQCIILARGGSKGIPGKNIMDFCGKPLLAWTIEQCMQAETISNVWVSSDNSEVLDVAKLYGAGVIRRPEDISGDMASSESGWMHAINVLQQKGNAFDAILAPQVTSPLREPSDIDNAVEKFFNESLDSLFSASVVDDLYFWGHDHVGTLSSVNYDYTNRKRRQDFQQQIIENGSFYLFSPEVLQKENNRLGGKIDYFMMEFWKMFEIDNIDDARMCSALMKEFLMEKQ